MIRRKLTSLLVQWPGPGGGRKSYFRRQMSRNWAVRFRSDCVDVLVTHPFRSAVGDFRFFVFGNQGRRLRIMATWGALMSTTSKVSFWVLVLWMVAAVLPARGGARPYQQPDSAESNAEI